MGCGETPVARLETTVQQTQGEAEPAPPVFTPADHKTSNGNLIQLALAMHSYHSQHGHLPHAAVYSKEGKPLLIWLGREGSGEFGWWVTSIGGDRKHRAV